MKKALVLALVIAGVILIVFFGLLYRTVTLYGAGV